MTTQDIKNEIRGILSCYDKDILVTILAEYLFVSTLNYRANISSSVQQCTADLYTKVKIDEMIDSFIKEHDYIFK